MCAPSPVARSWSSRSRTSAMRRRRTSRFRSAGRGRSGSSASPATRRATPASSSSCSPRKLHRRDAGSATSASATAAEGFITDATSGQMCRDATDYFKARDYGSGIEQITDAGRTAIRRGISFHAGHDARCEHVEAAAGLQRWERAGADGADRLHPHRCRLHSEQGVARNGRRMWRNAFRSSFRLAAAAVADGAAAALVAAGAVVGLVVSVAEAGSVAVAAAPAGEMTWRK